MIVSYPRRSFWRLWGSKCNFLSLASIPICNTPVLDVVWRSDSQMIFSTPPKRRFSCFFELKGLQNWAQRLRRIYSSSDRLSSQETSKQSRCRQCLVRNVRYYSCMFCMGIFAGENLTCAISKTTWPTFIEQSSSVSFKYGDNDRIIFFSNNLKAIAAISRFRKCCKNL